MYESARKTVAKFINAAPQEVVFTSGTTESLNLLSYTLDSKIDKNDEILISHMEHHANLVPWQLLAKKTGAKLRYLPLTKEGRTGKYTIWPATKRGAPKNGDVVAFLFLLLSC